MKYPFYSALQIVLRNTGRTLHILKYGLLDKGGWLRLTDLEHEIKIFILGVAHQGPTLVDVGLLIKTGDLAAAIGAAKNMDPKEYPNPMEAKQPGVQIPVKVLENLSDLLPATATDDSRGSLKCVCVNRKKREAVATNGHVLLLKKLSAPTKESFMLDAITLKIVSCFAGNVTGFSIRHREETKGADGKVSSCSANFLTVSGTGWQLISKLPTADDYPRYSRILPDRSKSVSVLWDIAVKTEVGGLLDKSMPFANPKSHMVHFTASEGIVKNHDLSFFRKTTFSKAVFPLQPEQVIAVNGEILSMVLRFVGDQPVSVTIGETMVNQVVFQGENCLALLMPLRTASSDQGITRTELLAEENGKTVPVPAPEKEEVKAA